MRITALFCLLLATSFAMAEDRPPNILLIMADDLGADCLPVYGNTIYSTPHLDRLAGEGAVFENAYATPVCSPTRSMIMTGLYPNRTGILERMDSPADRKNHNNRLPAHIKTFGHLFKEAGYATAIAGKWHLGHSEELYPQGQGFDINIGGWARGGPYTGKKYFAPFENPQMEVESPEGEHLPARLARDTAEFIEANMDQPFLAYLSFYSVHTPLQGRPDLVEKYKARAAEIVGEEFADEEQVFGDKPRQVRVLQKHAVYAAMVEAMDEAVGTVLDQLEASGIADNTIVVFTSDNGGLSTSEGSPTSNLPLRGGKGWVYEGGIREPWIIRYPGVTEPGSVSEEMICSIDLLPTVAAAAGIEIDHLIDGIDLAPALRGGKLDRQSLYWHYPHYSNQGGIPGGAIREGNYKLFERYEDGRVHLYDLKNDIGEQNDLAAEKPELVQEMRKRLHQWYKEVDAKFLQEKDGNTPWNPED